jgi:hypothetical protein
MKEKNNEKQYNNERKIINEILMAKMTAKYCNINNEKRNISNERKYENNVEIMGK